MADYQISAQPRTILGKKVRKLRREGLLPAVVYGGAMQGVEPLTVTVREFERLYARVGTAALIDLQIDGGRTRPVLIHQVQRDATRRNFVHVDFLAPDMRVELTVAVPLNFVGESPAVTVEGGILTQLATELQVRCLPDRIPAALEVDLSRLTELEMALTTADVTLPEGVALVSAEDEPLVKAETPTLVEEPVADEADEDEAQTAEAETASDDDDTAGA